MIRTSLRVAIDDSQALPSSPASPRTKKSFVQSPGSDGVKRPESPGAITSKVGRPSIVTPTGAKKMVKQGTVGDLDSPSKKTVKFIDRDASALSVDTELSISPLAATRLGSPQTSGANSPTGKFVPSSGSIKYRANQTQAEREVLEKSLQRTGSTIAPVSPRSATSRSISDAIATPRTGPPPEETKICGIILRSAPEEVLAFQDSKNEGKSPDIGAFRRFYIGAGLSSASITDEVHHFLQTGFGMYLLKCGLSTSNLLVLTYFYEEVICTAKRMRVPSVVGFKTGEGAGVSVPHFVLALKMTPFVFLSHLFNGTAKRLNKRPYPCAALGDGEGHHSMSVVIWIVSVCTLCMMNDKALLNFLFSTMKIEEGVPGGGGKRPAKRELITLAANLHCRTPGLLSTVVPKLEEVEVAAQASLHTYLDADCFRNIPSEGLFYPLRQLQTAMVAKTLGSRTWAKLKRKKAMDVFAENTQAAAKYGFD